MLIDLRSDTVTKPTPAMREAMYHAEVGDDVYSEDPTINQLQELAAERFGKEAGLFVSSGTMGNAAAILAHAGRGQSLIVGDQAHIYRYEGGGASTLGGIPMWVLPNQADGMLDPQQVENSISDGSDEHTSPTALLCLENTHNRCGGTVLKREQIESLTSLAHAHQVAVHMDGARIFNAATALGIAVSELTQSVDSLTFCLSKGLSAPVGSVLVGSQAFIHKARLVRKALGGGMRQGGILAAAGIVALNHMIERLAEDHEHCRRLALGLADFPPVEIDVERVVTNILLFTLRDAEQRRLTETQAQEFVERARTHGVLISTMGEGRIRAVTHHGIEAADIDQALQEIRRTLLEMQLV